MPEDSTGQQLRKHGDGAERPAVAAGEVFRGARISRSRGSLASPIRCGTRKPDWERKPKAAELKKARAKFFADLPENADRAAAAKFVGRFARLAWRRAGRAAETERLMKFYDAALAKGDAPRAALRKTLKPVLVAPDFLFRIEEDRTPGEPAAGAIDRGGEGERRGAGVAALVLSLVVDPGRGTARRRGEEPAFAARRCWRRRSSGCSPTTARSGSPSEFFLRWLGAEQGERSAPEHGVFPGVQRQAERGDARGSGRLLRQSARRKTGQCSISSRATTPS